MRLIKAETGRLKLLLYLGAWLCAVSTASQKRAGTNLPLGVLDTTAVV